MPTRSDGHRFPDAGSVGPYGKTMRPVGSEYMGKSGIVMVKVKERPSAPGKKDQWRQKQRVVWEKAHGRKLKDGREEMVIFCDHDKTNYDPDNLLMVPRKFMARMSKLGEWHDRETAEAVLQLAMLESKVEDAKQRAGKVCRRCGRRFDPGRHSSRVLCPECSEEFKREHGRV